jgi:phage terminase large subunit-like protein
VTLSSTPSLSGFSDIPPVPVYTEGLTRSN